VDVFNVALAVLWLCGSDFVTASYFYPLLYLQARLATLSGAP